MKDNKRHIDPATSAKHSFIFVLIFAGSILFLFISHLIEIHFGSNNFILNLLTPIASGLAFIYFLGPFVILVCGLNALFRLIKTKEIKKKPYFHALTSLIFGLVIIGYFVGSIVNKYHEAVLFGKQIACSAQIKGLGFCHAFYLDDYDSRPELDKWCDALEPYYEDVQNLKCPVDEIGPCSYAMNENIPADAEELPSDLVIFFESAPGWNQVGGADDVVTDRHGKAGANIAFANGEVKFVRAKEIPNLQWTIKE